MHYNQFGVDLCSSQQQNTTDKSYLQSNNSWTVADSAKLYNVEGWGEPYFGINKAGNVTVSPQGKDRAIDLLELIEVLPERNLKPPLLIRFPDILGDRLARLHECMERAISRYSYGGQYRGVFPIKCNQNRHIVEAVVHYGEAYQFGLEAGSKPELIIALASLTSQTDRLLLCNGYKDREYIETALLATKLGHQPIIIIEQLQELALVMAIASELNIEPILGVRAKLDTKGIGRWGDSTGDRAKFGLSVGEILQVVQRLKEIDKLDCLQLLHFHIGSQISAIKVIKNAIREASQIYVQLVKLGVNMQYLDVGGGLAVDYDGSKTNFKASKNYNMQNYANDIVAQVKDACERAEVSVPTLVSESGRAIAAHQSLLVFNVLGTSTKLSLDVCSLKADAPLILRNFWSTYQEIEPTNLQESYHDAIGFKQEALSLFNLGYLSLSDRALAEELYWACCHKISVMLESCEDIPEDLSNLSEIMAATYYINLSIFQSVPDAWAIEQLFPILPLHHLDRKPTARGILADITCDSDGKIDRFINRKETKNILELHSLDDVSSPYYLGMFLVGSYQEIMGNLHNLFGETNVVEVKVTSSGYRIESAIEGDNVAQVLEQVKYDSQDLLATMNRRTEAALQNQNITLSEAQKLWQNFVTTFDSYTYLS
jgi:arginine decarboxylase